MKCPAGHDTTATDYCDTCGLAIDPDGAVDAPSAGSSSAAPATDPAADPAPPASTSGSCPHCANPTPANALFCENCGYDFTTGALPRSPDPISSLDLAAPDDASVPPDPADDAPALPPVLPPAADPVVDLNPSPAPGELWVAEVWIDPDWYADQQSTDPLPSPGLPSVVALRHTSALIGRASRSRGINPDLDLGSDSGISRRHAQLTTDGSRWFVEDLGSSNGTYVGGGLGALPTTPIPVGQKSEVTGDDRIYLGAWTRIVLRKAEPGEVGLTEGRGQSNSTVVEQRAPAEERGRDRAVETR